MSLADMRRCTGCSERKALWQFARHPGFRDGRNSRCAACKAAEMRSRKLRAAIRALEDDSRAVA